MTRDWIVWLRCLLVGHIWCYDSHGPPVQDLGGPWYNCVRCNGFGRGGKRPFLPYRPGTCR